MRVLRKVVINPVNRSTPAEVEILQQAVDTFSEERAAELAEQFAEDGTWQVPTLIRLRTQYLCDAPEFSDDPDLQYMAESTTKTWQGATRTFVKKFPPPSRATFRAAYEVLLRMTKIFSDGGVPMLAGSDAVGAAWEVPGPVTAPRVRRARPGRRPRAPHPADDHPRRGRVPRRQLAMGTVDVGKNADLVLLDANPVDDAASLHQVAAVIRNGRHYATADLAALKDRVRSAHPAT